LYPRALGQRIHANETSMKFDKPSYNSQSHSESLTLIFKCAAVMPKCIAAGLEWFKELFHYLPRHADAGVGQAEDQSDVIELRHGEDRKS